MKRVVLLVLCVLLLGRAGQAHGQREYNVGTTPRATVAAAGTGVGTGHSLSGYFSADVPAGYEVRGYLHIGTATVQVGPGAIDTKGNVYRIIGSQIGAGGDQIIEFASDIVFPLVANVDIIIFDWTTNVGIRQAIVVAVSGQKASPDGTTFGATGTSAAPDSGSSAADELGELYLAAVNTNAMSTLADPEWQVIASVAVVSGFAVYGKSIVAAGNVRFNGTVGSSYSWTILVSGIKGFGGFPIPKDVPGNTNAAPLDRWHRADWQSTEDLALEREQLIP